MKKMKRKAIVCLFVQVVFDIIWDSTFVPAFILCWQSFAHLSVAAVFFSYISILIHANQVEKDVSLLFSLSLYLSSISFIHRKSIFFIILHPSFLPFVILKCDYSSIFAIAIFSHWFCLNVVATAAATSSNKSLSAILHLHFKMMHT